MTNTPDKPFPFSPEELEEIAALLGPYVQQIDVLKHISSGKSGVEVWLVQLIWDELTYRNKLLDVMKAEFENEPGAFETFCYRLAYDREKNQQPNDTLENEIVHLNKKALRGSDGLSLPRLVECFTGMFPQWETVLDTGPRGPYYLKIHKDTSNEPNLSDYDQLTQDAADYADIRLPDLSGHPDYKGRLLAFYQPAYNSINLEKVKPLGLMLKEHTKAAKEYVERTANWLRRWNDQDSVMAPPLHPYNILCSILGEKRVSGPENVQYRVKQLLREVQKVTRVEAIETARLIEFDGRGALPNPVAYLHCLDYWEGSNLRSGNLPSGKSHGDLHCGNIMCLRPDHSGASPDKPDIIDFGDYRARQSIFFDLLYFEFDLILQLCPPDQSINRQYLWKYICNYLMRSEEEIVPSFQEDVPVALIYVTPLILELRQVSEEFINKSEYYQDDFRAAFWLTAVAVGLNYARKSTLNNHERLLGLMYASAALRHALKLYGAPAVEEPSGEDVIGLYWRDVGFTS
jgi:hypothetical protein